MRVRGPRLFRGTLRSRRSVGHTGKGARSQMDGHFVPVITEGPCTLLRSIHFRSGTTETESLTECPGPRVPYPKTDGRAPLVGTCPRRPTDPRRKPPRAAVLGSEPRGDAPPHLQPCRRRPSHSRVGPVRPTGPPGAPVPTWCLSSGAILTPPGEHVSRPSLRSH